MENTIFETNLLPQKHSLIKISDDEGENIYLGSPFYGTPNFSGIKAKVNTLLILDLNILSDLRSRKNSNNIKRLLTWAAEHNAKITPLVALSEQQRTHKSPRYAYDEYLDALKAEYGWSINKKEIEKNYLAIEKISPNISTNTALWRDYLLLIKKFYHSKAGFKRKTEEFITFLLDKDLPIFTLGLYAGCSYFHMKVNPSLYDEGLISKVQSDMDIQGKNHEKRLMNVASDMALIQSSAELFYIRQTQEYNVAFIASKDITIPHILTELCWAEVLVNSAGNFGRMGFRPESKSGKEIFNILSPHSESINSRSQDANSVDARKKNLKVIANEIFSML
ncbi:hypothetical protein [Pseudomonas sp. 13B_3.2_Bac1]|uniref:hypothetical protein n=1 Tax=Pseudomonas sp. 13B_3.2_Bac1 TaxID=2971623 RepID=UPI0021C7DFCF|nr:hypothetical protein [Pseudomonas sp. 13B_3.2_Bac1]MCU1772258.1 hypothetical protein [Pseudomonas sp. 13B_3.2_Bac1]